jgi:hypothetical protein
VIFASTHRGEEAVAVEGPGVFLELKKRHSAAFFEYCKADVVLIDATGELLIVVTILL